MPYLNQLTPVHTVAGIGIPKSGKSTFGLTTGVFTIVLNYDGGSPGAPPGVDASNIFIQNYPSPEQEISGSSVKWKAAVNVGQAIVNDIHEINKAFREKRDIKLIDVMEEKEVLLPLPGTILSDGCVELYNHMEYWILGMNGVTSIEEYTKKANGNKYAFFSERLARLKPLYNQIKEIPRVNKIWNTWEKEEDDGASVVPDFGGAMDRVTPGKVDAVLRFYTMQKGTETHFMVDTKPNGKFKSSGVRGVYGLPTTIDLTIDGKDKTLPWDRVWNNINKQINNGGK